jgi:hypothetical protein
MAESDRRFRLLSFLLLFLFGGAIVGETVSLSMVITVSGPAVLGKLFFVNGMLLFLLPSFFFGYIDRINRGKLLSIQLLVVPIILLCYLVFFKAVGRDAHHAVSFLVLLIYPISYLSKTTLFLTFWTIANDIYHTEEAKKGFPKIASWGFAGGLLGACSARLLLEVIDADMILGLWAFAYFIAYLFSKNITSHYRERFLYKEYVASAEEKAAVFSSFRSVLNIKLIRLISLLYFLVFVSIFLLDYLFWKKSAAVFPTSNSLASFQFSFYLIYSFATILGLRFVMPRCIALWGFTRIFFMLPVSLLVGAVVLLGIHTAGIAPVAAFVAFVAVQFVRYVVFENAFSPVYQMFFAVIEREKRGRAKTFLEGIVKPTAILLVGLFLIADEKNLPAILGIIGTASLAMIIVVSRIRKTYSEALIPRSFGHVVPHEIIEQIGSRHDQKILSLIKEYSASAENDIRSLAVKILAHEGSKQAFFILRGIYENEKDPTVREMIARSLGPFHSLETASLIGSMLRDANPRIRANALFSLNSVDVQWKWRFRDIVKSMFFENNLRIQIEAARFLWETGEERERENVKAFLAYLLRVQNSNKRSAGLYLTGIIMPGGWENTLLENIGSPSFQVFTKSIEIIFSSASLHTRHDALRRIQRLSGKHIACTGRTLIKTGQTVFPTILESVGDVENKRMVVELIRAARSIIEGAELKGADRAIDPATTRFLTEWVMQELEQVYKDAILWALYRTHTAGKQEDPAQSILEDALRDQLFRIAEGALDVVTLIDSEGVVSLSRRDLDLKDRSQRFDMMEILETFGPPKIVSLVIPILRDDSWESLAKIGRARFHVDDTVLPAGLSYFLTSSNRWVCFCALYCLAKQARPAGHVDPGVIERLKADPYTYVARAAKQLSGRITMAHADEMTIEPFELLERVMSLKKTVLFGNVPAEKLMEIAEVTQRVAYNNGTLISREGELSDHLYIVKSGSLKIVKVKNNIKTILSIIRPGETYGEIGLFNQAPRSASAIANEDCELWVIQRSSLKRLLLEMPEIAYNFLEAFSEKLRKSGEEVASLHTTLSTSIKDYPIEEK